jgi:hypothetical protein
MITGNDAKKSYTSIFLIAFSALAAEIALSRLFSVITYYYLAFFALSIAMLGMTAGAVTVYIKENLFSEIRIHKTLAIVSILYAISLPVAAITICIIPVGVDMSFKKTISLIFVTFFCSVPFYFSGIIISALLTNVKLHTNRMYAADLFGAALGCTGVLAGLEWLDAVSFLFILGLPGFITAYLFNSKVKKLNIILLFLITLTAAVINNHYYQFIRPSIVKGRKEKTSDFVFEKWNSHSRVVVESKTEGTPQLWGPSPAIPADLKTEQYKMSIDGDAGTVLRKFNSRTDIEHLKYDLSNFAYYLRPAGNACIIGVGGGKDVQAAILFNQKKITGIDVNPVFIKLLTSKFKDFAGIADRKEVTLVNDEARSFLSASKEKFSLIQMSLIDTWAATGAGAFSLSENSLYTIEGWQIFLNRLDSNGLFTVSRWYNPENLGETGRLVSLAAASLHTFGIADIENHIALLTINNLATIIVSKNPFTNTDIETIKNKAFELQFNVILTPGAATANEILGKIIASKDNSSLKKSIQSHPLKIDPPTDDNPYFFNMLRLSNISLADSNLQRGVMMGNLRATKMLMLLILFLFVMTVAAVLVPLFLKTKEKTNFFHRTFFIHAIYYSLIGAGFMLLELALVQRLTVFLGRPVYALGILLFSIILSTGFGSLVSEKIFNRAGYKKILLLPGIIALVILLYSHFLPVLMSMMSEINVLFKVIIAVIIIFPLGLLLGLFFPLGMKLSRNNNLQAHTPWFWALNGIFGVLFCAIAVFISIYAGISYNFYLAAVFYFSIFFLLRKMVAR